jgi:hypothetical protein
MDVRDCIAASAADYPRALRGRLAIASVLITMPAGSR